ncbi:DUF6257 family protein [Streptomyces sp. NPDC051561]|uniref:DUF6257 family protein n=1 Tax=Streptomyces sp. NPDC051561 TaxID=3365658 RepID=UPI0037A8A6C5
MRKSSEEPRLTSGEKARIAVLVGRMCKREIAGPDVYQGDLERKVDRIIDGAARRAEREERAARRGQR